MSDALQGSSGNVNLHHRAIQHNVIRSVGLVPTKRPSLCPAYQPSSHATGL